MKSLVALLESISLWVLFSLLAIAFVGSRPCLALAICVVGGIAMALSSLAGFTPMNQATTKQANQKKDRPSLRDNNPSATVQ